MPKIIQKNNTLTGIIPNKTELDLGELAINTFDGKLFLKKDNGSVETIVEIGAGGVGGASELEKITEGSTTGWRILGRDPLNYGDIGQDAVDLSYSNSASDTLGATGAKSIATGHNTTASGSVSHAEGQSTTASGLSSHAEGGYTTASAYNSHSEGRVTKALGYYSHAEGEYTNAEGEASHSEGNETVAIGYYSHAEGWHTIALNNGSHSAGKYNIGTSTDTIHETGIGIDNDNKKNAFEIYTDGRLVAPELTDALINSGGGKSLVTKDYADALGGTGGVEQITEAYDETTNTGWAFTNDDRIGKSSIGDHAVDFSVLLDLESSSSSSSGSSSSSSSGSKGD